MPSAIVICRQASDYLKPGYVTGYWCRVCGKELQVGELGRKTIAADGIPLCNGCGFAVQRRLMEKGAPLTMAFSAEAHAAHGRVSSRDGREELTGKES